jgi:glycosyltransferase involved in cell wall biosynthesis
MVRRVLLLVGSLARAGTEHNAAMCCKHFDKGRYHPDLWVLKTGGLLESIVRGAGVEIHHLDRGWKYSPFGALRAVRQIAGARFDLLQAFLPTEAVYAALAKILFRLPQPMVFRCGWSGDSLHAASWRYGWLYRRAYSAFVANSPSSADFLESMGIPRERIRIIPNIHESERFFQPIDRAQVRQSLEINANVPLLIHVGRLTPTKRVQDLIEAVSMIVSCRPELRVLLVGDGPDRRNIVGEIERLNLQDHIKLLGVRSDVPALLRSSDLFVFPSETEGLPNAVIEASLAGLPIVACDVPGVRDVVRHGETALLCPPRDARALAALIENTLSNPLAAQHRAKRSQHEAEAKYSVDNVLSQLYQLYDELLGQRRIPLKEGRFNLASTLF